MSNKWKQIGARYPGGVFGGFGSPYGAVPYYSGSAIDLQMAFLHLEPTIVDTGHVISNEDLLYGRGTDGNPLRFEKIRQFYAAPGRMSKAAFQNGRLGFRCRLVRL
ncbi:hypothetical protein SDC9_88214 [bioreactor metagenome]|uniref:Uncharacterized protein n=1 Tax=bioreactor metagenome TaxID=1076179 RepID=A0A644ZKZ6_9ZZZZ